MLNYAFYNFDDPITLKVYYSLLAYRMFLIQPLKNLEARQTFTAIVNSFSTKIDVFSLNGKLMFTTTDLLPHTCYDKGWITRRINKYLDNKQFAIRYIKLCW